MMSIVMKVLTRMIPMVVAWLLLVREAWRTPVITRPPQRYRGVRRARVRRDRVTARVEAYGFDRNYTNTKVRKNQW